MKLYSDLLPSTIEQPEAEAVLAENGRRTWRQLESNARRFAQALESLGLGIGDRWAFLAHNRVEWPELALGNMRAGTRYVPLNWHLTIPELVYLLQDSGANMLIVDPINEEKGRAAAHESEIHPSRIFVLGPDFDTWLLKFPDSKPRDEVAGATLLYTGGTTGRSKGVIRSDTGGPVANWVETANLWASAVYMPERGIALITTPLYHAFGAGILQACLARRHRMVIKARFDLLDFFQTVEREAITSTALVPTLIIRLAKLSPEEWKRFDTSSLQWVIHTAAPCPAWAKQTLIDRLGPIVVEFLGSSEGTGPVACTSEEWLSHPGTIGRPNPRLEASVVDDQGNDLPIGSIGTLYFRRIDGPPVYHGDKEKTEKSRLPDGRFTVGDVGRMDAEGFIYLADRRVDLILTGGVNVYPAEIEGVLIEHPGVHDVAVFGIPDPEFGEQIKAAVELQKGTPANEETVAGLIAWCRSRLASFKCPKSIDFHPALPREASGKLKKRFLRDVYWEDRKKDT
ncbi:MAG: AMP-binding protein [Deltaproteobacteria bacterium]|nr:AMP-binding protein [Deltaproteobacteria bacterium]